MPKIRMFMPKILTSVYSFYKIYVKLSKMVYKVNSNVLKEELSQYRRYDKYKYRKHEWLLYAAIGAVTMAVTAWVFYKKHSFCINLFCSRPFYPVIKKKTAC